MIIYLYFCRVSPLEDDDMGFAGFLASIDVMVMGRKSFDKVISFGKEVWPYKDTKGKKLKQCYAGSFW